MNRLDMLEELLTHSDEGYMDWVLHDDLAALLAVAKAASAVHLSPWITQFLQDLDDAMGPLLKEVTD